MLHFDLNVSILLKEYPFLERFDQAARLGFGAVEFWWPAGEDPAAVARRVRDAGLRVALFNLDTGDMAAGDRGLLNDPDRQGQFRANLPIAIELAQRVGCTQLNALGGKRRAGEDLQAQLERVRENLRWAAEQAGPAGITILVEALNEWENGPYLFTNTHDTLALLDSLGEPNVKFQYDVYHMQRMEGNITATIRAHVDQIAHIQIADSPGRNQPGTGELRFPFIFQAIVASGYAGAIGLEYHPLGASETTFGWLPDERRDGVGVESIRL
jgi:hydroxypyruvate isomerase